MTTNFGLLQHLLGSGPYALQSSEKNRILLDGLIQLTRHHYANCGRYRNLVDNAFGGLLDYQSLEEIPFIPVSFFKRFDLLSVPTGQVVKVLKSSGTTGQEVSRIHLDAATADLQSKVLVKIMQHFLGKERLPMVILDHPSVVQDRRTFSARGAGILGMMQFGRKPFFALREDMTLDIDGLRQYLNESGSQKKLFFGFTFIVWQYFVKSLHAMNQELDVSNGVLIHSGGWKKLEAAHVPPETFKDQLRRVAGISECLNFYGLVEQIGSIYVENKMGFFQTSIFSDVIIRDQTSLAPQPIGKRGLIQLVSLLPLSYPGHSVLTEDLGILEGTDPDMPSTNGRFFRVTGRVQRAEPRGCSDTFEQAP